MKHSSPSIIDLAKQALISKTYEELALVVRAISDNRKEPESMRAMAFINQVELVAPTIDRCVEVLRDVATLAPKGGSLLHESLMGILINADKQSRPSLWIDANVFVARKASENKLDVLGKRAAAQFAVIVKKIPCKNERILKSGYLYAWAFGSIINCASTAKRASFVEGLEKHFSEEADRNSVRGKKYSPLLEALQK